MSRMTRFVHEDEGAYAVMIGFMFLLFIGLLAVVIDIGFLRDERTAVQNAADNAGMSAAFVYCNAYDSKDSFTKSTATSAAMAEAERVAELHGYTTGVGGQTTITAPDVNDLDDNDWLIRIDTSVDTTFAPASTGSTELGTFAESLIRCIPDHEGGNNNTGDTAFAGGLGCDGLTGKDVSLKINSNNTIIEGGLHSNFDVGEHASSQTDGIFNGNATYVGTEHGPVNHYSEPWVGPVSVEGSADTGGSNSSWTSPYNDLNWDDYDPSVPGNRFNSYAGSLQHVYSGDQHFPAGGTISAGVHVLDGVGKFTFGDGVRMGQNSGVHGATFVVGPDAQIDFSGNHGRFESLHTEDGSGNVLDRLEPAVFISFYDEDGTDEKRCTTTGISFQGNCNQIDGTIFAKYSNVFFSGNGNGNWHTDDYDTTVYGTYASYLSNMCQVDIGVPPRDFFGGVISWSVNIESGDALRLRAETTSGGGSGDPEFIMVR